MSLLIKALQKAEQSKSEASDNVAQPVTPTAKSELELAPPHDQLSPSLHEEGGFDEPSPSPVTPQRRAIASAVLRAGQKPARFGGTPPALLLAGGGVLLLLLLGGGFYYYLNSLEQPTLVATRPIVPPPAPQTQAPVPESKAPESVVIAEAPAEVPVSARLHEDGPGKTPDEMLVPAKPDNVVKSAENKTTPQIAPDSAVKVTRNRQPVASVNDQVLSGYQAYMAGDDAAAARYYRQAAQAEPRNVDAFLGLAAVAARQGKADEAATHYSRVLELEPRNISAQTGLIGLMGQLDPVASESRIKSLLAQQPEAAFLHAALGNLYADQGQWPSAQQAYFQAYHFDPANAEYAFNLAVSLDQMGKPDLALTHYQRALELQAKHGGALDKAQLEARITQLRQSSNK